MRIYIYKLVDPRNREPRYVGQTTKPAVRIKGHRSVRCGVAARGWRNELYALGLRPELEVIEEVDDGRWHEREQYWIKRLRSEGARLFNVATVPLPGPGYNLVRSEVTRAKLSASIKAYMATLSPEERKARAVVASMAALKSRKTWQTKEYLEKVTAGTTNRMRSLSTSERLAYTAPMRAANSYKFSPEHNAKISAAHKVRFARMTPEQRFAGMSAARAANWRTNPSLRIWAAPTFEEIIP
jgi:hypothetical protein